MTRLFLRPGVLLLLTWGLPCRVVAPCQEQKDTHPEHLNLKRYGYIGEILHMAGWINELYDSLLGSHGFR